MVKPFREFLSEAPIAIKQVISDDAGPQSSHTCDRCGAVIRYIFTIIFVDHTRKNFGSECINKALKGDHSLLTLVKKQQMRAIEIARWIDILKRPAEQMPRGTENPHWPGTYMIRDDGVHVDPSKPWKSDITFNRVFFHPIPDFARIAAHRATMSPDWQQRNPMPTPDEYKQKQLADIRSFLPKMEMELTKINAFLAKALQKYSTQLYNAPCA